MKADEGYDMARLLHLSVPLPMNKLNALCHKTGDTALPLQST